MGVICSVRFDQVTSLAAAFRTGCSFAISATGKLQNKLLQLSIREAIVQWSDCPDTYGSCVYYFRA